MDHWRIKCDSKEIFKRPSAVANPNTFVVMWKGVTLDGLEKLEYVALDLHYEGLLIEKDKPLKALGGLWIKGIEGGLNPEQRPLMKPKLKAAVPDKSPDPTGLKNFGGY